MHAASETSVLPARGFPVLLGCLVALAAACGALTACRETAEPLVEVGRWSDDSVAAVYIFYHLQRDLPETELQELLKPIARENAANNDFVVQVAAYDGDWARELATPETRQRVMSYDLLIGSPLVDDPAMTVGGGMVYTYYRDGDYDEFIFLPRDER